MSEETRESKKFKHLLDPTQPVEPLRWAEEFAAANNFNVVPVECFNKDTAGVQVTLIHMGLRGTRCFYPVQVLWTRKRKTVAFVSIAPIDVVSEEGDLEIFRPHLGFLNGAVKGTYFSITKSGMVVANFPCEYRSEKDVTGLRMHSFLERGKRNAQILHEVFTAIKQYPRGQQFSRSLELIFAKCGVA